jgi:hypothetical protein
MNTPRCRRAERIYGTQAALSKAMAYRVALAMKEALDLPTAAIASDGRGRRSRSRRTRRR